MSKVAEALLKTADYIAEHGLYQGGAFFSPIDPNQGCVMGSRSLACTKSADHGSVLAVLDRHAYQTTGTNVYAWSDNAPSADWMVQELRLIAKRLDGKEQDAQHLVVGAPA